jgi:hypothetical protein
MYREALAQLSLPGFILGGILLAITLLVCWGAASFGNIRFVSISDAWYPLLFYIWTAPFLFAVIAFRFLTSRRKSDFYHALPLKRGALFTSYTMAICTWLFSTIFIVMALGSGILALAGAPAQLAYWVSAAYSAFDFLTAALFATSLTILATSLSGTLFTSVVLTNVFLWLPLLVSSLFRMGVLSALPIIPPNSVSFFGLDLRVTLFDAFGLLESFYFAHSALNALWTLFVSLFLLGLAGFFFARRKSETAGNSAASNRMQAVFRIAVASPPLLIVCSSLTLSSLLSASGVFSLGTALILSLILICAFELISTKKWRNLLKVPLSYGIALVLALLFSASIWGVAAYEASFSPSAEEIRWVRIANPADTLGSNSMRFSFDVLERGGESWKGQRELRALREEGVRVDDLAVLEVVADQLADERNDFWDRSVLGSRTSTFYDSIFFDAFYGASGFSFDNQERLVLEVRTTGGATRQRYLTYGSSDWSWGDFITLNDLGTVLKEAGSR